jgi:hypothetical protein
MCKWAVNEVDTLEVELVDRHALKHLMVVR